MAKGGTFKITCVAPVPTGQCCSSLYLRCPGGQLPVGSHLVSASQGFAKKWGSTIGTEEPWPSVAEIQRSELWNPQNSSVTGHGPNPPPRRASEMMRIPLLFETWVGIPLDLGTPSKCSSLCHQGVFQGSWCHWDEADRDADSQGFRPEMELLPLPRSAEQKRSQECNTREWVSKLNLFHSSVCTIPRTLGLPFQRSPLPLSAFHLQPLPTLTITHPSLLKHHYRCLFAGQLGHM